MRHKCVRVQRESYTNDASATRVKKFDFDNDTSKNIFSHIFANILSIWQGKDYKERNNFILRAIRSKNCLVSVPKCV